MLTLYLLYKMKQNICKLFSSNLFSSHPKPLCDGVLTHFCGSLHISALEDSCNQRSPVHGSVAEVTVLRLHESLL